MNLFQNCKVPLFASLFSSSKTTSWPTYSSMPCEVALKSEKKYIKNQNFKVLEWIHAAD